MVSEGNISICIVCEQYFCTNCESYKTCCICGDHICYDCLDDVVVTEEGDVYCPACEKFIEVDNF